MVTASSEAELLRLVQHYLTAELCGTASVEVTTRRPRDARPSWRIELLWPQRQQQLWPQER